MNPSTTTSCRAANSATSTPGGESNGPPPVRDDKLQRRAASLARKGLVFSAERVSEMALLKEAIERSGLSARRFAVQVLIRDERTIRRWLAGDSPIPDAVLRFLTDPDNAGYRRAT